MEKAAGRHQALIENAIIVLLRVTALLLIALSLTYWLRAIGFYPGDEFRFDTMPNYWKAVLAVLCVLQPVAALGLWGSTRWGVVVWIITVLVEVVMYGLYPQLFGRRDYLLWYHFACLSVFLTLKALQYLENRQAESTSG